MHIFYIILYVLIFNMCGGKKVRTFLGPCTHPNRTVLSMLQHKMPNFSQKSPVLKRSAWTDYSTNTLYTNKIKICCFYYVFIFCANEWTTFCTLGQIHVDVLGLFLFRKLLNCCSVTLLRMKT